MVAAISHTDRFNAGGPQQGGGVGVGPRPPLFWAPAPEISKAPSCFCALAPKYNFPQSIQSKSKTSKKGLQRPAARYDGIGKIGGGYGFLVSMVPWDGWGSLDI